MSNINPSQGESVIIDEPFEYDRHSIPEITTVSGSTGIRKSLINLPQRLMIFLYRNQGRSLKIGLMMLVFITALYTKSYSGTYEMIINNHIGGILYVVFGSLVFSAIFPRMSLILPVLMATGITCMLEFIQWFRFPYRVNVTQYKIFAYLFGNSFNPTDFIFYGMGSVLALLVLWIIREN